MRNEVTCVYCECETRVLRSSKDGNSLEGGSCQRDRRIAVSCHGQRLSVNNRRLDSSAKAVNAPQEPTISRGWKDRLVRAIAIEVIRATTQAGGTVRLCARRVAYKRMSRGHWSAKQLGRIRERTHEDRCGSPTSAGL